MKHTNLQILALVACLLSTSTGWAQFGSLKQKLPGASSNHQTAAVSAESFDKDLRAVSVEVLGARILLLKAQSKLAQALGLKNEALLKNTEGLITVQGASSNPGERVAALKDSKEVSKRAQDEMQQKMAASEEMSAESKKDFVAGLIKFVEAIFQEKKQLEAVIKLAEQGKSLAKSANLAQKAKILSAVKPASDLASMVPGDIKEGYATYKQMSEYAKRKNIDLPSDSEAMKALEGSSEP